MDPHEILGYFEQRRDAIVSSICEIVDLESPSHDAERSRKVVDWVEERLLETGLPLAIERIPVDDGDHLIARLFPGEGPNTLLLGHTDTVHRVGANNPTRIDGDRLYGRGTFDMKSNIALMLATLQLFADKGLGPSGPL